MSVKFSNNAVTTLSASISAGATSFSVADASTFPTLGGSDWTYVSLTNEVVKVTAISGTTFTCEATTNAHASGESVELRMTAELLNDFAEDTEAVPITSSTGSAELPAGTTAQRDGSPSAGYLRWNTTDTSAEVYDGSAWTAVGGGNSTDEGLYEHSNTISSNYTIASGNNALTAGPITINTGVSVTVPTGSTWVIA